jgi:phosphoribosylformylglycinamidine synthase subunit PurQ / glutaminase
VKPRVLIPVAPGTNRDGDLAQAFELAGAEADRVPLSALRHGERRLDDYQLLGLCGGFSYGDALGAGRLLGLDLATWFADELRSAVDGGMPVIGVCNGFQALVRAGLLPGDGTPAVLGANASGRFECRWVTLDAPASGSLWTADLHEPLRCPVAHGEGRVLLADPGRVEAAGLVAFRYTDAKGEPAGGSYPANPNGSVGDIAGLTNQAGTVLGLMPHPEDHVLERQDPLRGRLGGSAGSCRPLFRAGVAAVAG